LVTQYFAFFVSWWGLILLATLDSTIVFFLPFGVDTLVIYLAARDEYLFWLYPLLATAGSTVGALFTFWLGEKAGEVGLEPVIPERRLKSFRRRVRARGAVAMALPALMPPPFPLSPFVLTCGALEVDRTRFFATFVVARLLRFGGESILAQAYGPGIVRVFESNVFQVMIAAFIAMAAVGTVASAVVLWRSQRLRHA
jgi:membrane protein YqaA with SNARE-associated domain